MMYSELNRQQFRCYKETNKIRLIYLEVKNATSKVPLRHVDVNK